jgi:hypothetical protein
MDAVGESWSQDVHVTSASSQPPVSTSSVTEEVVMPEQFFPPADRSNLAWTPERRLLLAVLEDAVVMFLRYRNDQTTRGKRLFRETLEWFTSPDRASLCAFISICDQLNLDAEYLRRGLWRQLGATVDVRLVLNAFSRRFRQVDSHALQTSARRRKCPAPR